MIMVINTRMKRYTVVTTFHQAGLELYGQRMIESFEQHWPDSVDMIVYTENCTPTITKKNVRCVELLSVSNECKSFVERHANNPEAHGGLGPHNQGEWSERKHFKWQGVRFCYKVFAVHHAVNTVNSDWIIWLDADSQTHSTLPVEFLDKICPNDYIATHLGRTDRYHSECGWVGYNRRHPLGIEFVNDFAGMYINDTMFNEQEWHDSYLFDVQRKHYRDNKGASFYNLNPEPDTKGLAGHPFINSELGKYLDHMKGERKQRGHSKAKEVKLHSDHPYWRKILNV